MAKNDYKRMSDKEKTQIKRHLNAIYHAANTLHDSFINKKLSYVGEISTVTIIFSATNFMHLCGIDYRRGTASFFQDSLDKKISLADIKIKPDGTTFQKLQVIKCIEMLLEKNISIVDSGVYPALRYDAAIRTRKKIIALSLKQNALVYVPISLLNLTTKEIGSGQKVIRIISEDLTSGGNNNCYGTRFGINCPQHWERRPPLERTKNSCGIRSLISLQKIFCPLSKNRKEKPRPETRLRFIWRGVVAHRTRNGRLSSRGRSFFYCTAESRSTATLRPFDGRCQQLPALVEYCPSLRCHF